MRRLLALLTRARSCATSLTANAVTALMIPAGLLAALVVTFAGIWPAVARACSSSSSSSSSTAADGEVARWRKQFSPAGVYVDQLAHYSTEAALPAALGIRADGGWDSIGGWTALGLLVSVLVLLLKSETHLVEVVHAASGSR